VMKTRLKLKNELAEIGRLTHFVRSFGREHGLSEHFIRELRLALEEVVANIISYGYEDNAGHEIEVCIMSTAEDISLSVRDDARPFNLLEHPAPDIEIPLEDRTVGGLGIHIVREIMDEISYKRYTDGNLVVMRRLKVH